MYLFLGIDPCDGYARIRWNTYKTWTQTQVKEYNLYCDITDSLGGVISGVLLKGGTLDTTFNHYGIINGYSYCYYVRAVDTTGTVTSTSNKNCDSSAIIIGSTFLQNPENDTVSPGQTAQFSVDAATGVSYQWQANTGNGFINIADGGQYQGTQDHTMKVFSAQPMNHLTEYRCIKAGGICSDTSELATLYISTIGILEQESNINIFPNPANEYITIESSNVISSIMIKDELGRILFQSKLRNKGCTINVNKWPTGAYILIIEQGNSIIQKNIILMKQ